MVILRPNTTGLRDCDHSASSAAVSAEELVEGDVDIVADMGALIVSSIKKIRER